MSIARGGDRGPADSSREQRQQQDRRRAEHDRHARGASLRRATRACAGRRARRTAASGSRGWGRDDRGSRSGIRRVRAASPNLTAWFASSWCIGRTSSRASAQRERRPPARSRRGRRRTARVISAGRRPRLRRSGSDRSSCCPSRRAGRSGPSRPSGRTACPRRPRCIPCPCPAPSFDELSWSLLKTVVTPRLERRIVGDLDDHVAVDARLAVVVPGEDRGERVRTRRDRSAPTARPARARRSSRRRPISRRR